VADGGGASFDRTGADVAGCKNPGKTGFEWSGSPFVFAPRWRVSDFGAGFNESFLVALDFRRQPLCAWASADHRKYRRRFDCLALSCFCVFQLDLLESLVAEHFSNLCPV